MYFQKHNLQRRDKIALHHAISINLMASKKAGLTKVFLKEAEDLAITVLCLRAMAPLYMNNLIL